MAKNFKAVGESIEITGQTASVPAGYIFRRTGVATAGQKAWIGVVTDDIIGTTVALTTVDGRPIQLGDGGVAPLSGGLAETGVFGNGKGDMMIEGVFTSALPTSGMLVRDGDPVYMQTSVTVPGTIASGVTNNQSAAFDRHPISGAFVGFAVGQSYRATTPPFNGLNVVDYKLVGFPIHNIVASAPGL